LSRPELPVKDFVLFDPFRPKDVLLADLIRIVKAEERRYIILQGSIIDKAVLELPYKADMFIVD
jgi:hypothetical protein